MVDLAALLPKVKRVKDWSRAGGDVDPPSLRRVVSAARALRVPSTDNDVFKWFKHNQGRNKMAITDTPTNGR